MIIMEVRAYYAGERIRAWRKRMGWKQAQAAKALGRGRRSYQSYEGNSEATPIAILLAMICLENAKEYPISANHAWIRLTGEGTQWPGLV